MVAKQVDKGGFSGVGLSLIKLLCKKKKKKKLALFMECLVPAGLQLSLGERKAKNTFAHVSYL